MKRLFYSLILLSGSFAASAQFTANNLVALKIGDGTTALNAASTPVTLEQLTTTGAIVNSTPIPSTGTSAVSLAGSATSEGFISLATNQSMVSFFGYKTVAGTAAVAGTSSATANRVVVSVDASGTITYPTLTATKFSASNPRSVISNGTSYWGAGGNTGVCAGNSTSNIDTVVSSTITNVRVLGIFGGQLYYSTGSGTSRGIWRVGTGSPVNSGITSTAYIITGASASPYGFSMNNDSTICYVADDGAIASGGGIQKWTRSGSTWTLAYTFGTGISSTVGARALAVDWSSGTPILYATTGEASLNRIIKITDVGSGSLVTTLVTATANYLYRGVTFTPGSNPLPVSWASFTASKVKKGVSLSWSTASETNNARFEVQRSSNNKKFETIAEVKGAGNSLSLLNYQFTDVSPLAGTAYYRIKQVDFDGKADYSKTATILVAEAPKSVLKQTLPNPFSNELSMNVNADAAGTATVEVIDMLGKTHYSGTEAVAAGDNTITINTASLNDGIYFVRMNINGETFTKKIIKK